MRPASPPAAAGAAAPASARNAAATEDGKWAPDGDGDGESRSGEDGGDGDGENRCDEDGGDGDGESRCGEVRPKAPSAAAAGSGEMRPARGRFLRQPRSAPRRPRTPLCGPRPLRPALLSRGP